MTRKLHTLLTLLIALPLAAQDSISAAFFRDWYHETDLIRYLEGLNDHTIVETHTTGGWWRGERLTLAIEGLNHTQNRYYIDGFRVDDRFQPGSTQYVPNMQHYHLRMNTHTSQLFFTRDTTCANYVEAAYNFGQVGNGEPAAGTAAIVHLFHRTAMESADTYKHVTARRHLAGAGNIETAFTLHDRTGRAYQQHLYAYFGQRLLTREDERGLVLDKPFYSANTYQVQADGTLPLPRNTLFERLGYRMNFAGREDGGSEYLYNADEVYTHRNYTASVYATGRHLTTGLTWATNTVHHRDLQFRKNIIDQDGESFAPWIADGKTHELTWAVRYEEHLLPWLGVHVDAYNSLLHFTPEQSCWQNDIYYRSPIADAPTPLYRYEWESRAYTGGLLENTAGVDFHYSPSRVLDIEANIDLTLDGVLLSRKSIVTPNCQAGLRLNIHPCTWFDMHIALEHNRMTYTAEHLRYLSDDYMNARVYYAGTNTLYTTTGGAYHHADRALWQPSYMELDIPFRFHFYDKRGGHHEFRFQQSYKKFYHIWHTRYTGGPEANGTYQDCYESFINRDVPVYFLTPGERDYSIGYTESFGTNPIMNTPYYFSQLMRYTYTGRKTFFSISWQSMQAGGYSALGNGPTSNYTGVLSETTASPNTTRVIQNLAGAYPGVGRNDLDKGFVLRTYFSYNICRYVQAGLTAKWTDGKPFTAYRIYRQDAQTAILPLSSRGTNPTDGNFGTRHGAVFHFDLHVQGSWEAAGHPMTLQLNCYNVWDFCHDLAEFAFVQDIPQAFRSSIIMTVPTGIVTTFRVGL